MSEKPVVVYLFGAGASAHAIPTVDGFQRWIRSTVSELLTIKRREQVVLPENPKAIDVVVDSMLEFEALLSKAPTPDTLARQAFISRATPWTAEKIARLTETLLLLRQAGIPSVEALRDQGMPIANHFYDLRYLNWLLSLTDKADSGPVLPHEIGVLTWNYDAGLLIALSNIYQDTRKAYSHVYLSDDEPPVGFPITFLNGHGSHIQFDDQGQFGEGERLEGVLPRCLKIIEGREKTLIRFAWDREEQDKTNAAELVASSTAIVAIGYSFPNYNAEVDIDLLKSGTRIKRVYVQTHDRAATADIADILWSRLEAAGKVPYREWIQRDDPVVGKDIQVREITNPHQFIIPPEAARILWPGTR